MVALNEKYHHNGTAARSNRCQAGKSWESEKSVDIPISVPSETSVAIQYPPRSSAVSLCKSVNPCGPIFCGYRYDPEGPGYYVRNRNYMPFLGRWLQCDPIGYAGGVNLYEYVGGRAVMGLDPEGKTWWTCAVCISCAGAYGVSCAILCGRNPNWGHACTFVGCMGLCLREAIIPTIIPLHIISYGCMIYCMDCAGIKGSGIPGRRT